MSMLETVHQAGQLLWLDDLSRELLAGGQLKTMRDEDGIGGITANPSTYDEAIAAGSYTGAVTDNRHDAATDPESVFWDIAVDDVTRAADLFRSVYDRSDGRNGLVSLELSPKLADDASATVEAGKALFERLDRPNTMIKVPGTEAGVQAITELTASAVNVNVTLLFGLRQYEAARSAYLEGLRRRIAHGLGVGTIHSVASFFLSRIDVKANERLPEEWRNDLAVALARLAYEQWLTALTLDKRWLEAKAAGANPQRLLWASTSSKSPDQSPTDYPERLIAPDTVITVPQKTLQAMRDVVRVDNPPLHHQDVEYATGVVSAVGNHGIDVDELADDLQVEGVEKFAASWDSLLEAITSMEAVTSSMD